MRQMRWIARATAGAIVGVVLCTGTVTAQGPVALPAIAPPAAISPIAAPPLPTPLAAPATATPLDREEQALWSRLVAARAAEGLPPLTLGPDATRLARDRSNDMATRAYFSHVNPDGKSVFDMLPAYNIHYSAIGETIAVNWNVPESGTEAAKGFITSPLHHEILFDGQYTAAGVGHVVAANGKHYYTIVVYAP